MIDDAGRICFRNTPSSAVQAEVSPEGCFSFCSALIEQQGSMTVDPAERRIAFHVYAVVVNDPDRVCNESCGSPGGVTFDLSLLPYGTYTVWLGAKQIGTISLPWRPGQEGQCMPPEPAPTPTVTPSPSPTAWLYPR